VVADAAYDAKENWKILNERGIEFVANMRMSSTGRFGGCSARGLQVIRRMKIGEHAWKAEVGYGIRWKVECAFSDFKRLFGDMLTGRKPKWMAYELLWRVCAHNVYKDVLAGLEDELSAEV
jgi:hypothetical protein